MKQSQLTCTFQVSGKLVLAFAGAPVFGGHPFISVQSSEGGRSGRSYRYSKRLFTGTC